MSARAVVEATTQAPDTTATQSHKSLHQEARQIARGFEQRGGWFTPDERSRFREIVETLEAAQS